MFPKTNGRLDALMKGMAFLLLTFCVSCTAAIKKDQASINGHLLAENSVLKKRVPLIERENDVLSKVNSQYKSRVQDLEAQSKQLSDELTALNTKYTDDMAAEADKIHTLEGSIQKAERESAARIERLTAQNASLKERQTSQIRTFKERMARQKDAFNRERDLAEHQQAQQMQDLSMKLEKLKKDLAKKELALSSLRLAIGEISTKLGQATALAEDLQKARDKALAELAAVKSAHAVLIRKTDDALARRAPTPESPLSTIH
jgi:chromosome segregation ATPase